MPKKKELWIGLVGMYPKADNTILGTAKGAYTNMLAYADSYEEYINEVLAFLHNNSLEVIEIEDIETFGERTKKRKIDSELYSVAEIAEKDQRVKYGVLDIF